MITGLDIYPHEAQKNMMTPVKHILSEVVWLQPDDASYEEIMRELIFERMIERGLEDSGKGRVISNEEMRLRIRSWQNNSCKRLALSEENQPSEMSGFRL